MEAATIIGWLGSLSLILGYAPQAIYTIRTRDTDGISLYGFIMMAVGAVMFMIQGFMLDNWPLFVTNTVTTVSSVIVFAFKIHNDYFKNKKK